MPEVWEPWSCALPLSTTRGQPFPTKDTGLSEFPSVSFLDTAWVLWGLAWLMNQRLCPAPSGHLQKGPIVCSEAFCSSSGLGKLGLGWGPDWFPGAPGGCWGVNPGGPLSALPAVRPNPIYQAAVPGTAHLCLGSVRDSRPCRPPLPPSEAHSTCSFLQAGVPVTSFSLIQSNCTLRG